MTCKDCEGQWKVNSQRAESLKTENSTVDMSSAQSPLPYSSPPEPNYEQKKKRETGKQKSENNDWQPDAQERKAKLPLCRNTSWKLEEGMKVKVTRFTELCIWFHAAVALAHG